MSTSASARVFAWFWETAATAAVFYSVCRCVVYLPSLALAVPEPLFNAAEHAARSPLPFLRLAVALGCSEVSPAVHPAKLIALRQLALDRICRATLLVSPLNHLATEFR